MRYTGNLKTNHEAVAGGLELNSYRHLHYFAAFKFT